MSLRDILTRPTAVANNKTPKRKPKDGLHSEELVVSPMSPELSEGKKRKRKDYCEERSGDAVVTRSKVKTQSGKVENLKKRRVYYKKVVYDEGEFEVGDDVYVKRREDASSDEEDPEVEECRICFRAGRNVMLECDDCLGGFHLKCLKPPLKEVPEGEWIELLKPPEGKKRVRTMREKLLSSDLWAANIQRFGLFFRISLL
ncbi:hypothetical protein KPL70_025375 [Citrus sinensis]|nr:hypothetical protein KPL70_025375 [Citrus sinensis]